MKKITIFLLFQICLAGIALGQIDISEARTTALGTTVTVEGIVTNGSELGIIRYLQDGTGGIAAYPGTGSVMNFPDNVTRGDLIQVTGELKEFNNLLEIDPITDYTIISSNNTIPDAAAIAVADLNENVEGSLVKFNNVTFVDGGNVFAGNSTYQFTDGTETAQIYVRANSPLVGEDIPLANVNLTGIASQFFDTYQLLIRDNNDVEIASSFFLTTAPVVSDISTTSFTLSWNTNIMGTSNVNYGLTSALGTQVNETAMTTSHSVTLTGLEPATIYHVQVYSENGTDVATSNTIVVSTASNSTGEMRIYFNGPVDASFSSGSSPIAETPAAMEAAMIELIDNAQNTIDFAAYNINRTTIVQALSDAHNRGVRVRYVRDDQTANTALQNPAPPFTVIIGNIGDPLMHNKFIVVDADSEDESWVVTGSTNFTDQNIATDFNNTIFIQDQALARSYEKEMNEMWGSDTETPNFLELTFGEDKEDNTPHTFMINGVMVENYFSPSDNTTAAIKTAIESADTDLEFILLSFTRNDLGDAVKTAHDNGVNVRGMINNTGDQGSEFAYLESSGVNMMSNPNPSKSLHHKYAIIDATDTSSDPQVITGSHNWSNGAETRNDENTIIIHDAIVANIFLQEFEARWAGIIESVEGVENIEGFEVAILPNPVQDIATLKIDLENSEDVGVTLWSKDGKLLQSKILRKIQGEEIMTLNVNSYPAGNYILSFQIGNQVTARQLVKQ